MGFLTQLLARFVGGDADSGNSTGSSPLATSGNVGDRELKVHAENAAEFTTDSASSIELPAITDHTFDSLSFSADSYHSATATSFVIEKSLLLNHNDAADKPNRRRGSRRHAAELDDEIENLPDERENVCDDDDDDQSSVVRACDARWFRRAFSDSEITLREKIYRFYNDCDADGLVSKSAVSHYCLLNKRSYSLSSLRLGGHPLLYDDDDADESEYDENDALNLRFPPPLDEGDEDQIGSEFDAAAYDCGGTSQRIINRIWKAAWQHQPFTSLPQWLQDNNYLRRYHRPQIQSVVECFKTIFRIHSETGNIWTHMLGCLAFLSMLIFMWVAIEDDLLRLTDKLVLTTYFFGALLCMAFSFLFHTLYCHSDKVGRLFGKLDYCGIACMIVGSFIPWLHYAFYCHVLIKWFYISAITLLAALAITVSLWNRFGEPKYRWLRAGLFMALGLSALVPSAHYLLLEGAMQAIECAGFLWLMLMAFLYVFGAILYAVRMPERFFPGRFDIFMHSHQIFHCMVIAAAFVHYHGIMTIMVFRMTVGACEFSLPQVPLSFF